MGKKFFLTFEEAKAWAKSQNIKRYVEWRNMSKTGLLPSGIPASPREAYKNEFKGWKDFLGAPLEKQNKEDLLSYEETKKMGAAKRNYL